MIKVPVDSLNIFAKYDTNLDSQISYYINKINDYVRLNISTYLEFRIDTYINIISMNTYYITLDKKCMYKPMCKFLNVDYNELDEASMCRYYLSVFSNKISKLKGVKNEAELQALFPQIYDIYKTKERHIKVATEIEYESKHIIPKSFYSMNKAKKMIKNNMTEKDFQQALSEAPYFNLQSFLAKVSYDLENLNANLSNILSILANQIIEASKIQGININKINEYVQEHKNKELKRQG